MKKNLKSIMAFSAIAIFTIGLVAFTGPQIADDWEVPAKYKNMENEYAGEDEDGIGEDLFKQHCRSCHGKEGYGDGSKAKELETEMRDLTSEMYKLNLTVNCTISLSLVAMRCLTSKRKSEAKRIDGW